jgi:hypothetical protein
MDLPEYLIIDGGVFIEKKRGKLLEKAYMR